MPISVRHSGAWQVPGVSVRDGGVWKTPEQVYVRDGGLWVPLLDTSGPPSTLTFITSGTTTTADTILIPATAQVGDLCVWGRWIAVSSTSGKAGHPSDWSVLLTTQFTSSIGSIFILNITAKVLEAGDPGAEPSGYYMSPASATGGNVMLIFRPDNPITTLSWSGTNYHLTDGGPPAITMSAAGAAAPCIAIGTASGNNSGQVFSSTSPAFTAEVSATFLRVGYTIYNSGSTPLNQTIDKSDQGSANTLAGGFLSVS